MDTNESHLEECPECGSQMMVVVQGYSSEEGNFVEENCEDCGHESYSADGDTDEE